MHIMITGGLGLIGHNVVKRLCDLNHQVAVVDNFTDYGMIPEDELLLVRNYLIGGLLGDLDGPFSIIARWKNIILNGQTEAYFYDSIHTIKSITAEELRELAQTYLQPDAFYELVVI